MRENDSTVGLFLALSFDWHQASFWCSKDNRGFFFCWKVIFRVSDHSSALELFFGQLKVYQAMCCRVVDLWVCENMWAGIDCRSTIYLRTRSITLIHRSMNVIQNYTLTDRSWTASTHMQAFHSSICQFGWWIITHKRRLSTFKMLYWA